MINDIINDARVRMEKSLDSLRLELAKIRTGRAHPSLLEHVHVDYYGSEVPVGQAASVAGRRRSHAERHALGQEHGADHRKGYSQV